MGAYCYQMDPKRFAEAGNLRLRQRILCKLQSDFVTAYAHKSTRTCEHTMHRASVGFMTSCTLCWQARMASKDHLDSAPQQLLDAARSATAVRTPRAFMHSAKAVPMYDCRLTSYTRVHTYMHEMCAPVQHLHSRSIQRRQYRANQAPAAGYGLRSKRKV